MRAKEFINLDIKNEGFFGGAAVGGLAGSLAGGGAGAAVGAIIGGIIGHLQDIKKTKQELQNLQAATASLNVELAIAQGLAEWQEDHKDIIEKQQEIIKIIYNIKDPYWLNKYQDKFDKAMDRWARDPEDDDDFDGDEFEWRIINDIEHCSVLEQILLEIKQVLSMQ